MKPNLLLILLIFSIISCQRNENRTTSTDVKISNIDTSKIAIIEYDPTDKFRARTFQNGANATLKNEDLTIIEQALDRVIQKQNPRQIENFREASQNYPKENFKVQDFIIHKESYKRQYIVIENSKGEKEVYVNMFCNDGQIYTNWKKKLIYAHGGGSCFFNFKLNLNSKKYYNVYFNSEA
ncbi:hypothetical protein [Flavobacterium silvaticum]|uniref:Lipoprotein n=1 Tax=Flavobacterium silvaticum TaxID=1852020 RepID=A0A972FS68_9FLAO|nr:hypothetical protein [Flavobacterium silvaticum]NMH26555.1 hypothetical protein [Flavobacterium silvaticum]